MALTLMKGSEAIAEAAIRAGARYFFGYPITPQTEIPEYMSARMPEVGGCFLQAESEVAAINMIYGAAGAGARALTSSSSPGVSLKQEGISYCAGAQLPAVILNVMRGGPGLGNIQASQGDYFQAVKGGGNGDYHLLTYAPASVQEAIDIMMYAFDKAEKYRIPVLFLADGIIAQMMEPVEMPEMVDYKIDPERQKFISYTEIQRIHNGQNRCLWRRKVRSLDMTVSLESQKQNGKCRKREKYLLQNRKHWYSRVQKRLMRHFFCMEKAEGLPFIRWIVEMSILISLWE